MKISIITPCYNSEKTIARTIDSVVSQKFDGDLEYIIVDGKSSDSTLRIIESYEKKYSYIKHISEKDNSMTEALNKGFKLATGDIIASLNADDEYLPGALNAVNKAFDDCSVEVIVFNTVFRNDSDGSVHCINRPKFFNPEICAVFSCPFPECAFFVRKNVLEKVGLFNEKYKYTQDLELYLRIYYAGYKFKYVNYDGSVFHISETNYSSVVESKMDSEVESYFKYPRIHRVLSKSALSKALKILLGFRKYNFKNKRKREK